MENQQNAGTQVAEQPEPVAPNEAQTGSSDMLKPLVPSKKTKRKAGLVMVLVAVLVVGAGVLTGYVMAGGKFKKKSDGVSPGAKETLTEAGIDDEGTFKDSAEGILVKGGIEGEGTYHLERGGDESKYVYMTSTVIDLGSFEGKKVMVWGETIAAKHAPWLMDVGKIKVTE